MSYKNIRIPVRGGGSRLQRVQVLKSGKYKFVKNLTKSRSGSRTTTKQTKKKSGGRTTTPPKSKRNSRNGSRSLGIPSLPTLAKAGVAISWLAFRQNEFGQPVHEFKAGNMSNGFQSLMKNAAAAVTTAEGLTKVVAPIALLSIIQRVLPRSTVNILGIRWRVL